VGVTFDRSALAALGGLPALSSDLNTAGLADSGWHVTGPSPVAGDGAVVTATHPFSSAAEAAQLASSLAGSGPASSRPFRITLQNRTTFWHVYSELSGTVDLTCGLDCFGDTGLKAATGYATGVNPAPLLGSRKPAQVFLFDVKAQLPGGKSNPDEWTPQLGRITVLSARTVSWNRGSVILVSVLSAVVLIGLIALVAGLIWHRRRRRREKGTPGTEPSEAEPSAGSGIRPAGDPGSTETVTPPS